MSKEVRITTTDNPYNPFTEWDQWFFYDLSQGYYTCERLSSIVDFSEQLTDGENNDSIDAAINELMKYGCITKDGKLVEYKKVYRQDSKQQQEPLASNN